MDDAVHVVDNNLSGSLQGAVRKLSRKRAYGKGLTLLQTNGKEAFGFRWRIKNKRVEVEQELE